MRGIGSDLGRLDSQSWSSLDRAAGGGGAGGIDFFLEGSIQNSTRWVLQEAQGRNQGLISVPGARSQSGGPNLGSDAVGTVVGRAAPIWSSFLWKSLNVGCIDLSWLPSLSHSPVFSDRPTWTSPFFFFWVCRGERSYGPGSGLSPLAPVLVPIQSSHSLSCDWPEGCVDMSREPLGS